MGWYCMRYQLQWLHSSRQQWVLHNAMLLCLTSTLALCHHTRMAYWGSQVNGIFSKHISWCVQWPYQHVQSHLHELWGCFSLNDVWYLLACKVSVFYTISNAVGLNCYSSSVIGALGTQIADLELDDIKDWSSQHPNQVTVSSLVRIIVLWLTVLCTVNNKSRCFTISFLDTQLMQFGTSMPKDFSSLQYNVEYQ